MQYPLGDWQELNWDPAQNDTAFGRLCDTMGPLDNATVSTSQGLTIKNATAMFALYVDEVCTYFLISPQDIFVQFPCDNIDCVRVLSSRGTGLCTYFF